MTAPVATDPSRSGGAPAPVRVVLAEDNALLRLGLARLVEADPELELVGTATDLPGLLEGGAGGAPTC